MVQTTVNVECPSCATRTAVPLQSRQIDDQQSECLKGIVASCADCGDEFECFYY